MKTLVILLLGQTISLADCTIANVLPRIRPLAVWNIRGSTYEGMEWLDATQTKPTKNEVETALTDCAVRETQAAQDKAQAKIDLNTKSKTAAQRIDALIKYLELDK